MKNSCALSALTLWLVSVPAIVRNRQQSCSDISLSIGGFGWINNCRTDSENTKNTDIAGCAVNAQSQMNYLNAYCK